MHHHGAMRRDGGPRRVGSRRMSSLCIACDRVAQDRRVLLQRLAQDADDLRPLRRRELLGRRARGAPATGRSAAPPAAKAPGACGSHGRPARHGHGVAHVGSLCCNALRLLPVLAKPSMARGRRKNDAGRPASQADRPGQGIGEGAEAAGGGGAYRHARQSSASSAHPSSIPPSSIPPSSVSPASVFAHLRHAAAAVCCAPRLLPRALLAASLLLSGCDTHVQPQEQGVRPVRPRRGPARLRQGLPGRRGGG